MEFEGDQIETLLRTFRIAPEFYKMPCAGTSVPSKHYRPNPRQGAKSIAIITMLFDMLAKDCFLLLVQLLS